MSQIDPQWIDVASCSDVGRVRTVNEDRFAEFEDGGGSRLLVVADGMGGHRGGETASRLAVEAIGDVFAHSGEPLDERMGAATEAANQRVYECGRADPELAGMGTTVVALCLGKGDEGWVAHVGDSRLYLLRAGKLDPLTADHSLVGEMQRQGMLSAEEAEMHPRRNELTRSIGVGPSVEVEVTRIAVEPGDRFLLCSDGLCIHLGDDEIREVLERERPSDAARMLVDQANAKGGHDNVTVQVVSILETVPLRRRGADQGAAAMISPESLVTEHLREARTIRWMALAVSAALVLLLMAAAFWLLRN